MATVGTVTCPKCGEDRITLVHEITDAMGKRYVCMVCSKEFRPQTFPYIAAVSGKQ